MDWPAGSCRNPSRGNLGISGFAHQQCTGAAPGPGDGRRPSIPFIPWQRRHKHFGVIHLGLGALPGRNCLCPAARVVTKEIRAGACENGAGHPENFATSRRTALHHGTSSARCRRAPNSPGPNPSATGSAGRPGSSRSGATTVEASAAHTCNSTQAREAQRGLLQHRRRAHQSDRERLADHHGAFSFRSITTAPPFFGFSSRDFR
jgi:hypothetical protein